MTPHRRTRLALYDFLTGTLPEDQRKEIAAHLAACATCARIADDVKAAVAAAPPREDKPSLRVRESEWIVLSNRIEQRIRTSRTAQRALFPGTAVRLTLHSWIRPWTVGAAGTAVVLAAVLLLKGIPDDATPPVGVSTSAPSTVVEEQAAADMKAWNAYLRRSRLLLTGIVNTPEVGELDIEQTTSRALLEETRALRARSENPETDRLLVAVEPIMLALANSSAGTADRDLSLIRDGVREQNLLFRLRLAETAYEQPPVMAARGEGRIP